MNQERYQRVKALFLSACEMQNEARQAFLDEQCADDDALRAEVEMMLQQDEAPVHHLETATSGGARKLVQAALESELKSITECGEETIPPRIGPYRILRKIGEGGMGIVYEAEQDQPRRTVALKVIRHVFASKSMLRRFEFEVQVLGRLEHTGIARIYEAGTALEGNAEQPFFAMEFIDGRPITDYAQHQKLDMRGRLELLARVCDAVHYAHQKGVIHRDLKPPNILVQDSEEASTLGIGTTGDWNVGRPKVLDFGVARATDADIQQTTMLTDAGQLIGTIPYMSPEQVAGDINDVDTRSDVYSLGVVLFEMLAGRLPHDLSNRSHLEAARIVRETEPMRLGAVVPDYRGDIETIVGKALMKEKSHRYQSAASFGGDIRRFLRDEPINARPASAVYQLRKLARRHKAMVAGVMIALLGLIGGTVFATWQAFVATEQRNRAVMAETDATTERDRALTAQEEAVEQRDRALVAERRSSAVNEYLRDMLSMADPKRNPNREITMVEALDAAAVMIAGRFDDDPQVEITIQETLGNTYQNLGKYEAAERHLTRLLELSIAENGDDHPQTHNARTALTLVLRDLGKVEEAERMARRARDGLVTQLGPDHPDAIDAVNNLALIHAEKGEYEPAEALLRETLERRARIEGERHQDYLRNYSALATVVAYQGRFDEAETLYLNVLDLRRELLGEDHPDVLFARNDLARLYHEQGKLEPAEAILRDLVVMVPRVLGEDHPVAFTMMNNLGGIYDTQGRHTESEPLFSQVYEFNRRVMGEKHPDTFMAMNNLAGSYKGQERYDLAEPIYLETLEGRREVLGDDHPSTINSINNLGVLYRFQKRYQEAEPLYKEAMQRFEAVLGEDHPNTLVSRSNLGQLYNEMELYSEALPYNDRVRQGMIAALPEGHWFIGLAMMRQGASLSGLQRFDEAEPMLLEAHEVLEASLGAEHDRTVLTVNELITLYERMEQPENVNIWKAKLPPMSGAETAGDS